MTPQSPYDDAPLPVRVATLCRRGAQMLRVDGVSVGLVTSTGDRSSLCATDEISARIEELQVSLGEGPCVDAWTGRTPVQAPDLTALGADRWPAFAPAAVAAGARAIFSVPLSVGETRLGALDAYRRVPGDVSTADLDEQVRLGEAVTKALLAEQVGRPPDRPNDAGAADARSGPLGVELYQASGMISVQLDITVDEALARLRAYAYALDRPLRDVAHDVVTKRLRLENDR